jgi:serine/threonine protein kinase/tetratricopeptide (TPR) repeat protein
MKCPKCRHENPPESTYCGKCATRILDSGPTETLQTSVRELTTGSTFAGRYQIIEELGKGGMGRVYKALDTKIKEKVALKLIRPEIASDKGTIERFANELKLARSVRHKNICGMYDLGEAEGTHFITMEFVPGEDLKNMIRMSGEIGPATAVHLASEICRGLIEAHRLGIVHRDLKPQNIMIDREGNARIMDFGIARSLKGRGITEPGVMIGTPEYMSPEQVEGKEADARADLYALGVILYEMLTGRVPFEGETPFAVAYKHKNEPPRDPRELNARIPEDLSRLVLKCMEKDKARRYQSAEELLADLGLMGKEYSPAEKIVPPKTSLTSKEITVKFNVRKVLVPAILVLAALAAAIFFFLLRKPSPVMNPKLALVSIFVNRTGDATLDPLGRVAAYHIEQGLSQTGIVEVVPTVSVLETSRVLDADSGIPEGREDLYTLAKSSGAGALVSGAYYLIDGELQFHAAITDAVRRKPIQTLEPLRGSLDEKMALITELRLRIMGALAMHFTPGFSEYSVPLRKPPVYEAYKEYLMGLDLFGVDYEQSVRHFARAVELDPAFTVAKMWMAVAYGNQGRYEEEDALIQSIVPFRDELSPLENRMLDWHDANLKGRNEAALRFVREADKLMPNQYSIKYLIGLYAIRINRPLETVEVYAWMYDQDPKIIFNRPGTTWMIRVLASAHHMLGEYKKELKVARFGKKYFPKSLMFPAIEARAFAALGKIGEIEKVVKECLSMDPTGGSPGDIMMEAARELYAHGHRDASREFVTRAIDWAESRPEARRSAEAGRRFYAGALYFAGRWDEAGRIYESLAAEYPENLDYQGCLGTLAARRGDRDEAMRIFEELGNLERPFLFGEHLWGQARIAALLGEKERAVALLREAFSQGLNYGVYLHRDIDLEPLWDYPPFKELLRPKG